MTPRLFYVYVKNTYNMLVFCILNAYFENKSPNNGKNCQKHAFHFMILFFLA